MVANSSRWTTRDLDVMPDDGGWKRYEIVDGELYVTRAPHIRHQGAGGNIHFELESWSRQTKLGKPYQTPGVILTPTDAVIPDVVWASNERLETGLDSAGHFLDSAGHFIVAPELMIEILSAGQENQQRDKELKLKLYSRYGVQEYWIVDWQQRSVAVHRHIEGELQRVGTLSNRDTLSSPMLPGFAALIEQIFQ
ncbi:Uma2 family endonuclease [filamentous cyanobacterium LEGE 11480]|uniref:Uma2 family endonuclease n=2 Tax=Romeriopsis TaxID=2992131 RepID=A0A928VUA2_9CYAN|nr:Uma2 family endonuclease [Romeriopsis navalis LEGE 11480]